MKGFKRLGIALAGVLAACGSGDSTDGGGGESAGATGTGATGHGAGAAKGQTTGGHAGSGGTGGHPAAGGGAAPSAGGSGGGTMTGAGGTGQLSNIDTKATDQCAPIASTSLSACDACCVSVASNDIGQFAGGKCACIPAGNSCASTSTGAYVLTGTPQSGAAPTCVGGSYDPWVSVNGAPITLTIGTDGFFFSGWKVGDSGAGTYTCTGTKDTCKFHIDCTFRDPKGGGGIALPGNYYDEVAVKLDLFIDGDNVVGQQTDTKQTDTMAPCNVTWAVKGTRQ